MKTEPMELVLSHKQFLKIDKDYERAATAVDLVYVRDSVSGITRTAGKKGFIYHYRHKRITDIRIPLSPNLFVAVTISFSRPASTAPP